MRIKGFFYIFVILLLILGIGLLCLSGQLRPAFFYVGEGLILFILVYLVFFYRKIVKPLNTIGSGMELLREQDFSSRLSRVGQYEADRIVNIFNRMMEQLKNERLRLREQNHFLDLMIKASPMGVIITSLDDELSELNPMALKMLGVRFEDVQGKKMKDVDSPLAGELASLPKGTSVYYLNGDIPPEKLKEAGCTGPDYHIGVFRSHPDWIDKCHELGMKVNVWTVDQPHDMKWFIEKKADFITTDDPVVLQQLMK